MVVLWFSHVFPWFSHGFPVVFPSVFPWFSYCFPMVFLCFPMVFLWFSHGFPLKSSGSTGLNSVFFFKCPTFAKPPIRIQMTKPKTAKARIMRWSSFTWNFSDFTREISGISYCGWASEILHHQFKGWARKHLNNGIKYINDLSTGAGFRWPIHSIF